MSQIFNLKTSFFSNISKPFKIHQQPPNAPRTRTTTDKEARNLSEEAGFKVMLKKGLEPFYSFY